jgi:acyl-coenzyme A thioesterase PaaI-like protein
MSSKHSFPPAFVRAFQAQFGSDADPDVFIPPVFQEMNGQILEYDPDSHTLTARFPAESRYHNPYRVMQGGMIAAAIDNTFGPLSVLVAPPNLTREMTVKYKKAVTEEFQFVVVNGWVESLEPPYLLLAARVESEDGQLFARAKARHFILPEGSAP